jgi:hypothetical protein
MAGVAGLEPVTSAVTGQRSNQLSYTPAQANAKLTETPAPRQVEENKIRAADAKEVGVGNPAEETYCYPNTLILWFMTYLSTGLCKNKSSASGVAKRGFRA